MWSAASGDFFVVPWSRRAQLPARPSAFPLGLCGSGGVRFLVVACDNGDSGAGLRQGAGNAKADAAVPAGHKRSFSRQVEKTGHAAPRFDGINLARPFQQP